jgi:uncharacterized membrane protein
LAGHYNLISGRSLERIAALSDGLFAIAMTLIVLDIHVPDHAAIHSEADLWHALLALAPEIVTYFMTFLTLGIFWVGQQTQLNLLKHSDRNHAWIHLVFLAAVAVTPFSASLLSRFIDLRLALIIYWLNVLALGITLYASWNYAQHNDLLRPEVDEQTCWAMTLRILKAQLLYALGAALCIVSTTWSVAFILLVQLNYVFAPRIKLLTKIAG